MDVLKNRTVTGDAAAQDLCTQAGATWENAPLCRDYNLITSEAADAAFLNGMTSVFIEYAMNAMMAEKNAA